MRAILLEQRKMLLDEIRDSRIERDVTRHARRPAILQRLSGKIARLQGIGLRRLDSGKTDSAQRTVALPEFAITSLIERRGLAFWGEHRMIFPSSAGTCRDPDNFDKQWRKVRIGLGVPAVTSHSFRKSIATMIDDAGLSARIGADQLGNSKVSMTQDRYMRRGKIHAEVAALLDRSISGE